MTPVSCLPRGDHLSPIKVHFNSDHFGRLIIQKANINAGLGGHFSPFNVSDQGGHQAPPLFIEGVTSGTQVVTMPFITIGGCNSTKQIINGPYHPLRWKKH